MPQVFREQVKYMNNDFHIRLCKRSDFDEGTVDSALCFAKKCDLQRLASLLFEQDKPKILENGTPFFRDGFYPYKFFDFARREIKKTGICDETGFLYIYIALAEKSLCEFEKLGFDDGIFFDTFEGISRSCKWYKSNVKNDGIYDYLWLAGHLRANVIRLGAFEYQNGVFGFDEMPETDGKTIKNGDSAVFLHIPFGTDFSKDARLDSYKKAAVVFGEQILVCDSWLLYPPNAKGLDNSSNIRSFADDFHIFHIDHDRCYEDLHRIFGKNADFTDINSLPCNTSLQRLYTARLKNGLTSGSAVGIRLLTQKM